MAIRVRRIRTLRGSQSKDLAETLKMIREAEFTIDSGAGSLGRPGAVKDEKTAESFVSRVWNQGSLPTRRHA